MFDRHQIEIDYQDIDIADEAFERLFDFFDKWHWHLDTRISASGKDINPDVLGYIFEQYINDRAQMGAYYTKEDITEYIGRNCIVPFLMDSVEHSTDEMAREFRKDGEVWTFLRESGDRYVFDAVKHGYSSDWRSRLPENIACGLLRPDEDASKPVKESNLHLLERRKDWNRPTPEPFALPTEIWRETIERLSRCEEIIGKIAHGEIKAAKSKLSQRLKSLTDILDKILFAASNYDDFDQWKSSHQPFHWVAEFYSIIHGNGGFDVIIGNPPYVEYNKKDKATGLAVSDLYRLDGYKTLSCGNLYAYVMERCKSLISNASYIGMIVPLSGHSTERMSPLVTNFYKKFGLNLHLNLSADSHPQKLFEGVKFRLAIFFVSNAHKGSFSTKYTRWLADERKFLFTSIVKFNDSSDYEYGNIMGKVSNPLWCKIYKKVIAEKVFFTNNGSKKCLYHNAPVNWIRSHTFAPYFVSEKKGEGLTTQLKSLNFDKEEEVKTASDIINSRLFFVWWITNSDCYHLNNPEIFNFRYTYSPNKELTRLSDELSKDMLAHSRRRVYVYKATGRVEYDEFYMKLSKPIIDEIDKVLAHHYGFTEEELDFIINYDIKYRMGDELNGSEE